MRSVNQIDRTRRRSKFTDQVSGSPVKSQREHSHLEQWMPSARFWDTLPKIYFTRLALAEHNRRLRCENAMIKNGQDAQPFPRRSARLRSARIKQRPSPLPIHATRPSSELKRFARHGGPDLTSIRGFPDPTMSDQMSRPSKRISDSGLTKSSKPSRPYDENYELKLAQSGIFLTEQTDENDDVVLPANYDDITARLLVPRQSLSPSRFTEKDFQKFSRQAKQVESGSETFQKVIPVIQGAGDGFYTNGGTFFNNLERFDPDLAAAVPDSYDGAPPLACDRRVLKDLGKHIVTSKSMTRPVVPNFYLECKGRKGHADVAQRQAAHTGAIGARGMMALQDYQSQTPAPQYDNKAYSFTSTYCDGTLKIYTSHATAPETAGGPPQYHMTQMNAFAMTGSSNTFREGATYYRNARDLAKEQRDLFIRQANQAARSVPTSKHSGHSRSRASPNTLLMRTTSQGESSEEYVDADASLDELALDEVFSQSPGAITVSDNDEDGDGDEDEDADKDGDADEDGNADKDEDEDEQMLTG